MSETWLVLRLTSGFRFATPVDERRDSGVRVGGARRRHRYFLNNAGQLRARRDTAGRRPPSVQTSRLAAGRGSRGRAREMAISCSTGILPLRWSCGCVHFAASPARISAACAGPKEGTKATIVARRRGPQSSGRVTTTTEAMDQLFRGIPQTHQFPNCQRLRRYPGSLVRQTQRRIPFTMCGCPGSSQACSVWLSAYYRWLCRSTCTSATTMGMPSSWYIATCLRTACSSTIVSTGHPSKTMTRRSSH